MTMLVSVAEVKARQNLGDSLVGVDDTIASMIVGAQLRTQVEYGSEFGRQTRADTFFLDSKAHSAVQPDGFFRCRLKQAFVQATPAVEYSAGATMALGEPIVGAHVDADRGVVFIPADYADKYVRITYTAGFETSDGVPDWLKEVILSIVPLITQMAMPNNRAKEAVDVRKEVADHVGAILLAQKRNIGFLLNPVF